MTELLRAENLTKSFPGVRALNDVSISLDSGELVAVVGENGAGKSTLMKILAGITKADQGKVYFEAQQLASISVRESLELGIALIHQELNLAEDLTIAENLFLGHEPQSFGFVDRKEMHRLSNILLERVGLKIPADTKVANLSIGKRQLVEIARALSYDAKVLIFDEPTSSLSQSESRTLFDLIFDLKDRGIGVLYISHRLNEVEEIADRVVVLKDGVRVGGLAREEINRDRLVSMMVGRDLDIAARQTAKLGERLLSVDEVTSWEYPERKVSFELREGEILGLAGLVGAGRTSLLEGLFGLPPFLSGTVSINGELQTIVSPQKARSLGFGLVPEDRKQNGLFLEKSVAENISITSLDRDSSNGLINRKMEEEAARKGIDLLNIKCSSMNDRGDSLSGGNQQKIVLAKWLELNPSILLLDEPTRGVDVGSKQEIYELIRNEAAKGVGVLFVSSDLEEVLRLATRVLVMHEGELVGELVSEEMNEESIMALATGGQKAA